MTTQDIQEKIIEEFKIFNNLMDKYDYLIKLGKNLPSIDPQYKIDGNLIKGCQVRTWFHSTIKDGKVFYDVDSASALTRGFITLLLKVLSGRAPDDIKNTELYFIDKAGLRESFSPLRANSLWKLLTRMQSDAVLYGTKKL